MDRTSILVIALCFVLLGLWSFVLVPKLYPTKPLPPGQTNSAASTLTATNQGAATSTVPPAITEASQRAPLPVANTNVIEELLVLTNDNARYTFTTHGGGLKLIELLQYKETVSTRREKRAQSADVATLNSFTIAPTLALLGGDAVQGDGIFKLVRTIGGVRAEKSLTNGLTIVKEFTPTSNYLVAASVELRNNSEQALNLPAQQWVVGTATPMGARDNGQAVGVMWYDGSKTTEAGATTYFATGCRKSVAPEEYRAGASNVVWVAAHNQFFALAAMPRRTAQEVIVQRRDLPRATGEAARWVAKDAPRPQGYEASLIYPPMTLGSSQSVTNEIYVYAGPKEFQTLARIGDHFTNDLDKIMSFGWAGVVSKALLLGMNWLHGTLKMSYGWAIVAITVIIKVVFWPLTQASTRSMKRMQALQPQMKAIQEKYKDDPVKMNKKVMEFMKEHKVSPLGGCLPMLLQIPVFFGFFSMIQSAIELRGQPFLWVGDLSQPDTLYVVPGLDFIPVFGIPGVGLPLNPLPLIMGATMLWQARLTPPSPGMDPAQARIMRYMPLLFMVFLYKYSAGLTLYWTVQNLLTIVQTKITKTVPESALPGKGPVLTPLQKKKK